MAVVDSPLEEMLTTLARAMALALVDVYGQRPRAAYSVLQFQKYLRTEPPRRAIFER
jgi:hypothetical protein